MPVFNSILINLDLATYSDEESKAAIVSSRSMTHYIERASAPLRYQADFYRLCIRCSKQNKGQQEFSVRKDPAIASVELTIDLGDFLQSEQAMHNAFEKVIRQGFGVASSYVGSEIAMHY